MVMRLGSSRMTQKQKAQVINGKIQSLRPKKSMMSKSKIKTLLIYLLMFPKLKTSFKRSHSESFEDVFRAM
jgi:hypothetical protein